MRRFARLFALVLIPTMLFGRKPARSLVVANNYLQTVNLQRVDSSISIELKSGIVLDFNTSDNNKISPEILTPMFDIKSDVGQISETDFVFDDASLNGDRIFTNFTDIGIHKLQIDAKDDQGNPGSATFDLTVTDSTPPYIIMSGGDMSSVENNLATPINISSTFAGNAKYVNAVVRNLLMVIDLGTEGGQIDRGNIELDIPPLTAGVGVYKAPISVSDNFHNKFDAELNLVVREDIPSLIIVKNALIVNAPNLPILQSSDIISTLKTTSNYGDRVIKELSLNADDYLKYQNNVNKFGMFVIKYSVKTGIDGDSSQDVIKNSYVVVQVPDISSDEAASNRSLWEQLLDLFNKNWWSWIIVGIISAIFLFGLYAILFSHKRKSKHIWSKRE